MKNKNHFLYYWQQALFNCGLIVISGSVIQGFLLESGASEDQVSLYVTVTLVIQTAAMLLLSRLLENVKNIRASIALTNAAHAVPVAALIVFSLRPGFAPGMVFGVLFGIAAVLSVAQGIQNVLVYKLPFHIMDIRDYGRVSGQSGVILGVTGAAFSLLMSFLIKKTAYFPVFAAFSAVALAFLLVSAFLVMRYRINDYQSAAEQTKRINLFRYRPFYRLLAANVLRGLATGIFNLAAVIGYSEELIVSGGAEIMVALTQVATILGCQSYARIAQKHRNGLLLLISGFGFCAAMPFLVVGRSFVVFCIFYFITSVFNVYISYAIPVLVAERIDYACIGQYNAWRLALYTLGVAAGSACVPFLLRTVGGFGALLIGGILMVPCGIGYYRFERRAAAGERSAPPDGTDRDA